MFIKSVLKCVIVIILIQIKCLKCNAQTSVNQTPSRGLETNASLITASGGGQISVKNVTSSDKKSSADKKQNNREFPPSTRRKKNSDNDYYDSEISAASSDAEDLPECILSRSEFYLSWWVHENGSLKLPTSNRSGSSVGFADLSVNFHSEGALFNHVLDMTTKNPNDVITFMSIANNELHKLPVEALKLVNISLQYLSLANNNFNYMFQDHNDTFQSWTAFPIMNSLKELDLRNCSLSYLEYNTFDNLQNIEKLFLSHNLLSVITARTLRPMYFLNHLDLSYNRMVEITSYNYMIDPFTAFLSGMLIEEEVFHQLPNLVFLDLSHSKLKQESVRALARFREKLEQLSLCYTEIPLIAPFMFMFTNLKVLDLSGNPNLNTGLTSSWFGGLETKLEILIFKNSYIKNIASLRNLKKLRMLDLGNNNINQVYASNFNSFSELEILDLSMNHISNWYEKVFEKNDRLNILNLRNNNINLMTPEMMSDFYKLKFLAIGGNSFVCDCALRAFIERAAFNAKLHQCTVNNPRSKRSTTPHEFFEPQYYYEVFWRKYHFYISFADESCKNIMEKSGESLQKSSRKLSKDTTVPPVNCDLFKNGAEHPKFSMNFEFLLLDYNENDYHCVESDGLSKQKVLFNDITACNDNNVPSTDRDGSSQTSSTLPYDGYEREDEEAELPEIKMKAPNTLLIIYVSVGIPLTLFAAFWIWKRKDIKYFCTIFKNTLILSLDKEDKKALMMTNRRRKSNCNDDYTYDVFVSYCESDRDWVLEHLIPNIERRSEVTICLHERDFQVGLSILENIIQCMDQSRCLLLVISESFLKSNWCSFEMHLAQHRLIETRREQLILVLLQDISKTKRPRTLNFLMRTKTYIMWPTEDKRDLRNVFWRRLKKAIVLNNWEPETTEHGKARHSVV